MKLFWFAACWLSGIAAGKLLALPALGSLACAFLLLIAAFILHKHLLFQSLLLGLVFLFAGSARFTLSLPDFAGQHIANLNDSAKRVSLTGLVIDDPDRREGHVNLVVQVEEVGHPILNKALPYRGRILLRAPGSPEWGYGQRIRAVGTIQTPPEDELFSYREYLARSGIHSLMPGAEVQVLQSKCGSPVLEAIFRIRHHAWKTVEVLFPEPESSLVSGILLGIESGIESDLMDDFNRTGTSHIIVISGFNITIIAGICLSTFGRIFGRKTGGLLAILTIGIYTLLVGGDPAVTRAAIMGGITLIAFFLGRQTLALNSLAAASIAMTAINPFALWDLGFQLSFAATLGLVIYAEPLEKLFIRIASRFTSEVRAAQLAQPVGEIALLTLAAQLTTLPLILYSFRRFPLSALIANPLILPLQPPLMLISGLATLLGMVWIPLGKPVAWGAWIFSAVTIRIVEGIAAFPVASIHIHRFGVLHLAASYLLLAGASLALARLPETLQRLFLRARSHIPATAVLAGLALAVCLVWRAGMDKPDRRMHLYFLDVGAGDSTLVVTPQGRHILINGGSSPLRLENELGVHLPLFQKEIDWLILNGTGEHQLGGLTGIAQRYPIRNVLVCGSPGRFSYRLLMDQLSNAGIPIRAAQAGQWLDLGDGARLDIIPQGDRGCVLELSHGGFIWFTSSLQDLESIRVITSQFQLHSPTVYLLPDGGDLGEDPTGLLDEINPWLSIASVEAGDPRRLLPAEGDWALEGRELLRTDRQGTIHIQTNGVQVWAVTER